MKRRRILISFTLLLTCMITVTVSARDYLWPTDASRHLTSSFGEYRPGHYHSAIDIKTWGQEGYKCYAVADGRIWKIRISPFGYGKVIYLKLNDGRFAVYAHLQRFPDRIEQEIRNEQLRQERYTVTWTPKNWPVKKGEVIAYTGQTGIGVPHLHFEIRDENHRPMNPLQFYDKVEDNIAPRFQSLMVIPLTDRSSVNGSARPRRFDLYGGNNNIYKVKEAIRVNGKVGLAIRGYDKADGIYNTFGFYETRLQVGGDPVFRIVYDRLNFSNTDEIDIETHYPTRANTRQVFHKLYIEPYSTLDIYDFEAGDGRIEVTRERTPFRVDVRDFAGNGAVLEGALIKDGARPARMTLLQKQNQLVYARLDLPADLKTLRFSQGDEDNRWQPLQQYEILSRSFGAARQQMLVKLKLPRTDAPFLKTSVETSNYDKTHTISALSDNPHPHVYFDLDKMGKYLLCMFEGVQDHPELRLDIEGTVGGNQSITPYIFNNRFEHTLPARAIAGDSVRLTLRRSHTIMLDTVVQAIALNAGKVNEYRFFGDRFRMRLRRESLYDTLIIQTSKESADRFAESDPQAPLLSPVYAVEPGDQIMKEGVEIEIDYDNWNGPKEQVGLYKVDDDGGLHRARSVVKESGLRVRGRATTFGRFVVAADSVAPEIDVQVPRDGAYLRRLRYIRFRIGDELSGIGSDRNIRVTVDGRFVIPEWDPEKDLITAKPHWRLSGGRHAVEIHVSDRAGNNSKRSLSVFINE